VDLDDQVQGSEVGPPDLYQSEKVHGVYHVLPSRLDTDPFAAVRDEKQKKGGGEYRTLYRFPWALARARLQAVGKRDQSQLINLI
jgi:hypothetical protein